MIRLLIFLAGVISIATALLWLVEHDYPPLEVTGQRGEDKLIYHPGGRRELYREPGVALRIPLLSRVERVDTRLRYLELEAPPVRIADRDRILVTGYVLWRVRESQSFVDHFAAAARGAEERITEVARASLGQHLPNYSLAALLGSARRAVESAAGQECRPVLEPQGVEFLELRISHIDWPGALAATRSDLEARVLEMRRESGEQAQQMRAQADREAQRLLAEAQRDAAIARGQGEAEAARIFAEAHNRAPEFYSFQRRLEAYRRAIGANTTLVLSPDADFFQLLQQPPAPAARRPAGAERRR